MRKSNRSGLRELPPLVDLQEDWQGFLYQRAIHAPADILLKGDDWYEEWAKTPTPLLGGKSPAEYVNSFDDPHDLASLWIRYAAHPHFQVPDVLNDKMVSKRILLEFLAGIAADETGSGDDEEDPEPLPIFVREQAITALGRSRHIVAYGVLSRLANDRHTHPDLREAALSGLGAISHHVPGDILRMLHCAGTHNRAGLMKLAADFLTEPGTFRHLARAFRRATTDRADCARALASSDDERAIPLLEHYLPASRDPEEYTAMQAALARLGGKVEQIPALEEARLQWEDSYDLCRWAEELLEEDQPDLAERLFRAALARDEEMAGAWKGLARVNRQRQRGPEALECARKALEITRKAWREQHLPTPHEATYGEVERLEQLVDELSPDSTARRRARWALYAQAAVFAYGVLDLKDLGAVVDYESGLQLGLTPREIKDLLREHLPRRDAPASGDAPLEQLLRRPIVVSGRLAWHPALENPREMWSWRQQRGLHLCSYWDLDDWMLAWECHPAGPLKWLDTDLVLKLWEAIFTLTHGDREGERTPGPAPRLIPEPPDAGDDPADLPALLGWIARVQAYFRMSHAPDGMRRASDPVADVAATFPCVDRQAVAKLSESLRELWMHTPRWELYGHLPAAVPEGAWGRTSPLSGASAGNTSIPRVGRNDPCPCGSGKKYKKCCGGPPGTP